MKGVLATAAFWALAGCGSVVGPVEPDVRVLTSVHTFSRLDSGQFPVIQFSVSNPSRATIYLSRCGDVVGSDVLRHDGSEWLPFSSAACPALLDMSRIALPPGGSLNSERSVDAPGRYRLRVGVSSSAAGSQSWQALSNEFVVE